MKSCVSGLGETLFQTSQNIVLVVTEDEIIKAINPAALNHLGYQEDDIIDKDFHDLDDEIYKNYNVLNLCNSYVDNLNYDDETKQKLKNKLKQLHDLCAYSHDIER